MHKGYLCAPFDGDDVRIEECDWLFRWIGNDGASNPYFSSSFKTRRHQEIRKLLGHRP